MTNEGLNQARCAEVWADCKVLTSICTEFEREMNLEILVRRWSSPDGQLIRFLCEYHKLKISSSKVVATLRCFTFFSKLTFVDVIGARQAKYKRYNLHFLCTISSSVISDTLVTILQKVSTVRLNENARIEFYILGSRAPLWARNFGCPRKFWSGAYTSSTTITSSLSQNTRTAHDPSEKCLETFLQLSRLM